MRIDSLKFSRERQSARGSLPLARLERLQDTLFSRSAAEAVTYEVSGGMDENGRPVLHLAVSGQLQLQCQRCLGALSHELAILTTLRQVAEESLDAEMSDDPDEPDCIAASQELDLAALIEDEILLALPAFPRHDERVACGNVGTTSSNGVRETPEKVSAFSALAALKPNKVTKSRKSKE